MSMMPLLTLGLAETCIDRKRLDLYTERRSKISPTMVCTMDPQQQL